MAKYKCKTFPAVYKLDDKVFKKFKTELEKVFNAKQIRQFRII